VAIAHRRYFRFGGSNDQSYTHGIAFYTSNGKKIVNFAGQHATNCTRKHQRTDQDFKPLVRIYKNARNKLISEGIIEDGLAPSYFIEGLLYKVRPEQFRGNYGNMFGALLDSVIHSDRSAPQAQLLESRTINLLHFQSLIASKAARIVLAAPGKTLVDFGLRQAHGAEAGLLAARASYLAGFAGSATTLAEPRFGVPIFGTMAHSFIQAHDDEESAFLNFARARPQYTTLLIDTYDTEEGARKVVRLVPKLKEIGVEVRAVRLDSGDLAAHARRVRAILDQAGLQQVGIFASGGLDERLLQRHAAEDVPIDGYGVGTSLTTSQDAPALDCAYKLQEYAGVPKRKRSEGKATWPGRKQVWRRYADGTMAGDVLTLEDDPEPAKAGLEPQILPVMQGGRRIRPLPGLAEARERAATQLQRLPEPLRRLEPDASYPVVVSEMLQDLARAVDKTA
jgi:nicotinate phosphoribosyltransferase